MIYDFTVKDMSDLLYDDLSKIQDIKGTDTETTLTMPTTESVFPCRVLHIPLETINMTDNARPIRKTFQVTIECWSDTQRFCMEMADNTDKVLQKRNFTKTNPNEIGFDAITKKYRIINTYEVRWNALTNSFQFIR